MKAVIDTNILVPGIWRAATAKGPILDAWHNEEFELVTSEVILSEVEQVLHYPRIRRRGEWGEEEIGAFMATLRAEGTIVDPRLEIQVVRDAKDNRFLEAAVAGEADCVVSLDRDLLSLREYAGVQIVTPQRFLAMLAEQRL